MILTKEEFEKYYNFNSQAAVCRLIREGKIRLNKSDLIDTTDEINAVYCQKREEKINKKAKSSKTAKVEEPKPSKTGMSSQANSRSRNQKSADQLGLEIDLLNARLEEKQKKNELTRLKIAKSSTKSDNTQILKLLRQTQTPSLRLGLNKTKTRRA